jgi:hypothetical protein
MRIASAAVLVALLSCSAPQSEPPPPPPPRRRPPMPRPRRSTPRRRLIDRHPHRWRDGDGCAPPAPTARQHLRGQGCGTRRRVRIAEARLHHGPARLLRATASPSAAPAAARSSASPTAASARWRRRPGRRWRVVHHRCRLPERRLRGEVRARLRRVQAADARLHEDLRAYCGCDGKTFRSSGSCPAGCSPPRRLPVERAVNTPRCRCRCRRC